MPETSSPTLRGYLVAVASAAAAVAVPWLVAPGIAAGLAMAALPAAVVVAVRAGGLRPALLAAAAGSLACAYLVRISTSTGVVSELLALVACLSSCSVVVAVVEAMRRAIARAERRSEDARRELDERFSRFMRHLPGLAWMKDLKGRYVFANDAAEKAFRTPREDLYGRRDEEVFPRDVADRFTENDRRALESGTAVQVVEELEHDDGIVHRSIVSKFPVPGPDGEIAWVGGIAIDVTDQIRAEQALRDSEARLRAVVETAVDGIVTIDESGVVESVNPAVERLFGYAAAELLGRNVSVLMPEPYRGEHDSYLESYRRTGRRRIIGVGREVVGLRKDGTTFPMDLAVSELSLGGRRKFTGLLHDQTARKTAEEGLREADRRKTEFLATLAHELRNPLAPIRNSLEILKRAEGDLVALRKGRETIGRQVDHLVRLVDDLVDVSRITRDRLELRRERIELATVIQQAVETCRPVADRQGQAIDLALPEAPVYVDADPVRLVQVVGNLIGNACKFSHRGKAVQVAAARRDGEVVLSVKDSGIGIPPERLESVFEMFVQLEPPADGARLGLGIGLTLSKRLVELHGGTIEARSEGQGRGSEFVVRLPLAGEGPGERVPPAASVVRPATGRLRVLVVDDNEDSACSLSVLLQLGGHDTRTAFDGLSAVDAAGGFRPDVVMLDIGLPGLSGLEACRRIRAQPWGPGVVIVAITGWGQEGDRDRSRDAGFDAHLVKPVAHDALVRLLESVHAGPRRRQPEA
jgi:PAS domain S-box-containing protein